MALTRGPMAGRLIASFFGMLFTLANAGAAEITQIERAAFSDVIGDRSVSFAAYDLSNGHRYILEGSDTATRHAPWSTFKIPNLLIALKTGVSDSLEHPRRWDAAKRPAARFWPDAWRQDQTLRTAFERSAVWYFRDIALEVGAARYRSILADWQYGNANVPDGSDDFWLGGPLMISVDEQVRFIKQMLGGKLAISSDSIRALVDASHAGNAAGASLHGKTGSGPVSAGNFGGPFEGWYVGFVLRDGKPPIAFALYAEAPSLSQLRDFRKAFAVELLQAVDVLPAGFVD